MTHDNFFKTKDRQYYIIRKYDNGDISFVFKEEEFHFIKKYEDKALRKFKSLYDELDELMEIFKNPTVRDVTMPRFGVLLQKTEKAIEHYERLVPKEFRKKLGFDKDKLEELILNIQKEFYNCI